MFKHLDGVEVEMTPEEIAEFEAFQASSPAIAPKTRLYKATVWRRCTDEEYDAIQAVISAVPRRLQAIFRDADYLSINDELYPMIVAGATQAVGAERAAELLEPEE